MSYNKYMRKKKILNTKRILIAGAAIVGIIAVLNINFTEPIPHRNLVDTKISLYSDKRITPNAVAVSPEFKHLAFETPSSKKFPFSNQSLDFTRDKLAAVIKSIKSLLSPTEEVAKEHGSWIWTPILEMTPAYMESILSEAKTNGVNTMYVSVDSYLDIFVMAKGEAREKKKKEFGDKLEDFIIRANRKGIVVDAEAGWRNWAESDHEYKAFAIVNYVKNFNAERQNKFRGFQYDVEPYLLEAYATDPAMVLKDFIALVDKTKNFLGESDLKFSVVVPDFYDEKDGFTPKFSYNGKKTSVFKHLLQILDERAGSSVIIMSYRSFADGYDGSIEVSQNEMQTGKSYETKIIIAQEVGDVPPPYITFHRTSKEYLNRQIVRINDTFAPYANFGGIAIHYVNAYLDLK